MILTSLRRASVAAAAVSLSLALAACGGDEEATDESGTSATSEATPDDDASESTEPDDADESDDAEGGATVLSEEEMTPALITAEDLPGGYVVDPDDEEEDSDSFAGSCLEGIGDVTDQPEFDADEETEASYILEGDAGQSGVQSQVQSYADEQQVISAISMFSEAVAACPEASGTDPDGTSYDLEVLSDQTVSLDGVDEQARVAINGTITSGVLELPVDIGFNVARIANNIVIISTLDIGEAGEGIVPQTDVIAQVSVDRLAEVTGG